MASLIKTYDTGEWVLELKSVPHGVVAGLTGGLLRLYPTEPAATQLSEVKAHDGRVNGLRVVKDNTIVSCGGSTVKVWDVRNWNKGPQITYTNDRDVEFLSVGAAHGKIAAGTELQRPDAELYLWDLRSTVPIRKFVDSHQDDITDVRFHPTNPNILLSSSTDGYANVYDLSVPEEDDALHQVINFSSIHSTDFLSEKRIYTLSHMETFAIHELNDTSDEDKEPRPTEFGDVREPWGCEYVVDVYPGLVACGANSKHELKLYKFDAYKEKVSLKHPVSLPGAHGEEVVRAVHVAANGLLYTGGEDSRLKVWKTEPAFKPTKSTFFEPTETDMDVDTADATFNMSTTDKPHKKKHRKDKHKRKERFKPY